MPGASIKKIFASIPQVYSGYDLHLQIGPLGRFLCLFLTVKRQRWCERNGFNHWQAKFKKKILKCSQVS